MESVKDSDPTNADDSEEESEEISEEEESDDHNEEVEGEGQAHEEKGFESVMNTGRHEVEGIQKDKGDIQGLNEASPSGSGHSHTGFSLDNEAGPSTSPLRILEGGPLSPVSSSRHLSRSPPASRHASRSPSPSLPSDLVERAAALSLHETDKERVANEVAKQRARQQRKYHSKRGAQRIGGRQKGSKAKMDTRVKRDKSGVWE